MDSTGYIDLPITPLFPFGFGLSHATFRYSSLAVGTSQLGLDGQGKFSAGIANTGPVAGTEIVQLYVRDLIGQVTRPVKELMGFQRVTLQPGERAGWNLPCPPRPWLSPA